ncbi:MAG: type II secretion system ATPase GspE [Candidatus Omnitrophica bacterium]|nr:type II secretion system ATPase GspE [Candidatus Omnitrophota bacterium]
MAETSPQSGQPKDKKYKSLGKLLMDRGMITENQLQQALDEQRYTGKLLGRTLVELGFVKEEDILKTLGIQAGIEFVDLSKISIPKNVLQKISPTIIKIYKILPIKFENGLLTIAMSDPLNVDVSDDLRFMLGCNIKGVIATEASILDAIQKHYGEGGESIDELLSEIEKSVPAMPQEEEEEVTDVVVLQELASQPPVVKLLNLILLQAVKDRASDIHFEPFEDKYMIRYRVDGILYDITNPPKNLALAVSSRIKVMSNLDIAERRLPQDGRTMVSVEGKNIDLRVSTLPTVFGESVVMRVLDKDVVSLSLDQIGMSDNVKREVRRIASKPNGIMLATGPTGCGKTTTLYSCLREINKIDYKIITTEDPVEYDIPGIIQVSIKPKINLNFATCLRHILRQDPDIIMVGEIRDAETAQIAIQASLTGHLVLSTLHTNDAPGTITRLINMGVEPFLITSTLEVIIAQRLVRVICKNCRERYDPDSKTLEEINLTKEEHKGMVFYRGKGCSQCNKTGYRGRTGIYELLVITEPLKSLIMDRVQTNALRDAARKEGMLTLREDGLQKVREGITTLEEVVRETQQYV